MPDEPAPVTPPVRLLVDEMLGRLARYLRFVGFDAAYARGVQDVEILRWTDREDRVLVTRDRRLAAQRPGTLLLTSTDLAEQLRTVRGWFPHAPFELRFERCTLCNGVLRSVDPAERSLTPDVLPPAVQASGTPIFQCAACDHVYWEGSHTRAIRERLRVAGR